MCDEFGKHKQPTVAKPSELERNRKRPFFTILFVGLNKKCEKGRTETYSRLNERYMLQTKRKKESESESEGEISKKHLAT